MYLLNLAKHLISHGHQVRVLLHQANQYKITKIYNFEGVEVFPPFKGMETHFNWASHVFTHLEYTSWTIQICSIFKKPCYFIVHNTHDYSCAREPKNKVNIVYNSQAAADKLKYPHPSIVLHPPVDYRRFNVCEDPFHNEFITIINYNDNKGGWIFREIARLMPKRRFLAVAGSYDEQVDMNLPNVTVRQNSPDILPVYKMTRILLMPSEYESWGMTCTEAMCNGIPVICTPTFGLKENAGDAGIFVRRLDIPAWIEEIKRLDDENKYKFISEKAPGEGSIELDPVKELDAVEQFLLNTPADPRRKGEIIGKRY